ncbi:hypothetical protein AVEN_31420-1 [Araneus ventricosus]|uniref:Uncharacterized protein n=1 Tax=Araneus ventricosus TaxID=182803 RepID=A0A4Y2EYW2_ARAVE|nr:hypothetical protein AVEN_31420-1 [Araneus ventricosus]
MGEKRELQRRRERVKVYQLKTSDPRHFKKKREMGRGGLVVLQSSLRERRVQGSKHTFTEDQPCLGLLYLKLYALVKHPLFDELQKEVPAQMLSSSSDCGSK